MSSGPTPAKSAELSPLTAVPMRSESEQHTLRITYQSGHNFETTRARLNEQVPLIDPLVSLDLVRRDASWSEVESTVSEYLGPTGFVALARLDQGALLSLNGEPLGATRYLVGNPLLARRVLSADPAAALYAPFGMAVFADHDGGAHVSYDQPSSLFAAFKSTEIEEISRELDNKIDQAVMSACSPSE